MASNLRRICEPLLLSDSRARRPRSTSRIRGTESIS